MPKAELLSKTKSLLIHPPITAFGATFILFLAGACFWTPFFQTNDDVVMSWITRGIGLVDRPSEFLILVNVIVGIVLKNLYTLFPHVPWYALGLYGVFFLSVWGILTAFLSEPRTLGAILILAAVGVPVFFHCFAWPQYTVYCFLAAQAGLFLLAHPLRPRWFSLSLSGLLMFLAALIRLKAALFSVALGFFYLWTVQRGEKDPGAKKSRWATLALTALLILSAAGFDRIYCHLHPGWPEARRYYQKRFSITEIKWSGYQEQLQAFQSVGWSENDYHMFQEGFYYDGPFAFENLEKLDNLLSIDYGVKFILFKELLKNELVQFLFLGLLVCLAGAVGSGSKVLMQTGWILFLVALLFSINKIVARVLWPQLFFACLVLVFLLPTKPSTQKPKRWVGFPGVFLAVILGLTGWRSLHDDYLDNRVGPQVHQLIGQTFKSLAPRKDQLFVIWGSSFPFVGFPAFETEDTLKDFRFIWMWWLEKTPYTQARLDQFRIHDFIADMVDNPKVFWLINDPSPCYENYLREHEGKTMHRKLVFHGYFDVYRLVSGP